LHRVVGEGGMGVVYEATHARLAGRYAIKVLLQEHADRPDVRARFDREAQITSLLQHPNIVQVIDHNSTADGTSYLVMEFLSGESLEQRLVRLGRMPVADVVDIVGQLAAGLAAAHGRGIVHRDLKPGNVCLVPVEGRAGELAKILDFGISKVSGARDAMDREICGTPQYMAPEQVDGRAADIDASTDQYALGVIAHELLTGANPFADESVEAVFFRVSKGEIPPTGLGAAIDAVLARAMSRDRARRFPSVVAFAEAFRAATLPPVELVIARRPRRRTRDARFTFAAAAVIGMTAFMGTGAAKRAAAPTFVWGPASAPARAIEPPPAPVVTADAAPELPVIEPVAEAPLVPLPVDRAFIRRARASRLVPADRPPPVPSAPVRRPPPTLAPDEDATLPLSAF
jgi:serine/threonine-protein kinase